MAQQIKISAEPISNSEKKLFAAVADDLAAIRAQLGVLTAKLDADAGTTDTNYTALVATPLVVVTTK